MGSAICKISPDYSSDVSGDGPRTCDKKNSNSLAVFTIFASKSEKKCVVAISMPLLMGPEFSSDTSGDGLDKDNDEKKSVIDLCCSRDSETE